MLKKLFAPSGFKISIVLTLLMAGLFVWNYMGYSQSSFLDLADKKVVDMILKTRPPQLKDSKVAIVAIDTKAVDKYGRWPWGRDLMAKMVRELRDYYEVNVIGFDIVFSEPDPADQASKKLIEEVFGDVEKAAGRDGGLLSKLSTIKRQTQNRHDRDGQFAHELEFTQKLVNGYFFYPNLGRLTHLSKAEHEKHLAQSADTLYDSVIQDIEGLKYLNQIPLVEAKAVELNTPKLSPLSNLHGYFNIFPDHEDGTVRRVHLVMRYQGDYYPSLDLQMIRQNSNAEIAVVANEGGISKIRAGYAEIETASDGSIMINYMGPAFTFPHHSVYDVIHHKVPKKALVGKIVLIGATEVGVFDLRTTPVGVDYPGVEVHANILHNIINNNYFRHPDYIHLLTFASILFAGLLTGFLLPKMRALPGALFVILLLGIFWGTNLYLMKTAYTWLSFTYVTAVILLTWVGVTLFQFFGEEKDKRFIKAAFGQYLSPKVIDQLVTNPKMLKLGGEKKVLTAFFSDLQGFSSFSEHLTPEQLVELLNEYLTRMCDIILQYGGTVDKFEGDAIIAFFGAPLDDPDHAKKACLCSLEMQRVMQEMRKKWNEEGRPELFMRIGLNTGPMVVGNMGSATRMDYTIMGDSVNLASRLEGINKQYNTYTMISEHTFKAIGDSCFCRELDQVRVVGKSEPTRIYELVAPSEQISVEERKPYLYYAKGLKLMRERNFAEAKKYFAQCVKLKGDDGPSKIMYARCQQFLRTPPPPGWDGVHNITSK